MTAENIKFPCGELELEGVLHLPQRGAGKMPGIVLCHPHPLFGGNMDNNVVMAAAHALNEEGIGALRFNFRGVGLSEGIYDEGEGEQDDARAALGALAECPEIDAGRLGLLGYSFGGMIALAVGCQSEKVQAMGAISPVLIPDLLKGVSKPAYFISGSKDHVVSPQDLGREVEKMTVPGRVEVAQGVDHFWWGSEVEMASKVADFFSETLKWRN